jgi:hypothetical protein
MITSLMPTPKQQYFSLGGIPLVGGKVYTYAAGTTTPKATYTDSAGTVPQQNPIVLNARGEPANAIFWSGAYKVEVRDALGNLVYSLDNYNTDPAGLWNILTTLAAAAGSSLVGFIQSGVGAVLRTVQNKLRDEVSIKDFGAVGDGVANDTAALTLAINSLGAAGGRIYFPQGMYLINPINYNGKNYLTLCGAGREATQIISSAPGTLFTFTNCSWLTIRDMKLLPAGVGQSMANAYGVQLDGSSNNATIDSVNFVGFSKDGLRLVGGPGAAVLSGHKVMNCYFLGNGGNQLYSYYSADFHILNNQFGGLNGLASPVTGALLDHSEAGQYSANYHYFNVVGMKMTNSNYNRVIGNRFEESQQQGVYVDGVADLIFTSNAMHTNSLASKGTYDNAYFKNIGSSIFADNNSYDFSGGVSTGHRWGMYFDTGCDSVHVKNNKFHTGDAPTAGPIYINPANVRMNIDSVLQSSTTGTINAANTAYLGAAGQQSAEANAHFMPGRRAMVQGFICNLPIAPGPGQTTTFELYKNGSATGMTGSCTGASGYIANVGATSPPVYVEELDTLSLKVVTGATANATQIGYLIKLSDY